MSHSNVRNPAEFHFDELDFLISVHSVVCLPPSPFFLHSSLFPVQIYSIHFWGFFIHSFFRDDTSKRASVVAVNSRKRKTPAWYCDSSQHKKRTGMCKRETTKMNFLFSTLKFVKIMQTREKKISRRDSEIRDGAKVKAESSKLHYRIRHRKNENEFQNNSRQSKSTNFCEIYEYICTIETRLLTLFADNPVRADSWPSTTIFNECSLALCKRRIFFVVAFFLRWTKCIPILSRNISQQQIAIFFSFSVRLASSNILTSFCQKKSHHIILELVFYGSCWKVVCSGVENPTANNSKPTDWKI